MSGIIGLALRMSAVRALTGATLAGSRVFDSAILPLDRLISDTLEPFISLSTEDEESSPSGRDLHNGAREIELVIEIALARTVKLPNTEAVSVAVPDTDAGLELTLGILGRQVEACLFGRGGSAWGNVFRALTPSIKTASSRRGLMGDKGSRIAARQLIYRLSAIAEPAFGTAVAPDTPVGMFLAAIAGDAEAAPVAGVIRQAIEGAPFGWPEVYTAGAALAGLTEAEAAGIGIAALPLGDAPTILTEVTTSPDGDVINEAGAAAQLPEEP